MEIKFDFDDIIITPEISTNIESRYNDITLPQTLPIFTAPMDTVVDLVTIDGFIDCGVNVVLPRTIKYCEFRAKYDTNPNKFKDVFVSFGIIDIGKLDISDLHENAKILIDVANGHMQKIIDLCKIIKELRPDIIIMAGNIANPETYAWYSIENCVDYIRLGIGAGGGCLTSKNSAIGYPLASLIYDTNQIRKHLISQGYENLPSIIADGGLKNYADIIKAYNLGADYVMLGSIFNQSFDSCADNFLFRIKLSKKLAKFFYDLNFPVKKYFRGMSTKAAQKAMGNLNVKTSEDVIRYRKIKYYLKGWIENFNHYLRNSMSYSNCSNITQFIGKSNIIKITNNSYARFNK